MIYHALANMVLVLHLAFIVFVVLGAALSWRFPRLRWLHFAALAWAAFIEFSGGICPLTPLENRLRRMAGGEGYGGGFIAHYLMPIIYPEGLTRGGGPGCDHPDHGFAGGIWVVWNLAACDVAIVAALLTL